MYATLLSRSSVSMSSQSWITLDRSRRLLICSSRSGVYFCVQRIAAAGSYTTAPSGMRDVDERIAW